MKLIDVKDLSKKAVSLLRVSRYEWRAIADTRRQGARFSLNFPHEIARAGQRATESDGPLSLHERLHFPLPLNLIAALLHHLITGQDAPKIGGRRVLRPYLRPLRIIAMPRARLEVAERFVVHPV